MRTITPRWIAVGLVLLAWAAWSLATGDGETGSNQNDRSGAIARIAE